MKDFNYYSTNPVPFPKKTEYTYYYVYSKGKLIWEGNSDSYREKYPTGHNLPTERSFDKDAWQISMDKYRAEERRLINEFTQDLYEEFGVEDNPKRDICFQLAWEHGHASGFYEVHSHFQEFVQLIQ